MAMITIGNSGHPCHNSYYTGINIKRMLASDLGLLAKRSDGNTIVFVNDLNSTAFPVLFSNYTIVTALIEQHHDTVGKAVITTKQPPASRQTGAQRGYLKLLEGESLSISNFDVGGERVAKGLKGFLYGERGVWRPGDSLYITFILEDKLKLLPSSHPVVFELQNPQGQVTERLVRASSENGFTVYNVYLSRDAPCRKLERHVKVGGTEFTQPLRIETVKPNRLKIN
jgi:uncharacterized protein YfaS (alpha-2-macroglobulin family)